MAQGFDEGIFTMSMKAAVDMSSAQYKCVRVQSGVGGFVQICSVAAEEVDAILINKPNSGEHASLVWTGITRFRAGIAVKGGDKIITDAAGFGIVSTVSGAIGKAISDVTSGGVGTMIKFVGHTAAQA